MILQELFLSSATTVDEARWLEAQGVDAIIVQGIAAKGHRGSFLSSDASLQLGTLALVPQVVDAPGGPGHRRRGHRRRERCRGGQGARRGRRAGRDCLPPVSRGEYERRAWRGAQE